MEFLLCPNFNTLDRNSMSLSLFVYMFFMLENNANPVVRLQNTNVKMPRGSTTKLCVSCKAVIGVATKTCKVCQTIQPMRQRLAKKLEKFQSKKETWLQKHKKNKTTTHVLDEASVLVEKLNTLGQKAIVFIARPGKKTSTWHTHVIHPRWQLTDQAGQCLDRMKDLYELMINAGVPAKKKKKRDNKKDSPGECSHGGEDQFYPVKQVLKTKKQKGKLMEFVEWEPCSMCGKTWSPQWVEKRNTKK
ncbi:uncharacterized protein LOC111947401 isoform X1 [Oryzias latipes]|uniref:uncharacterized protein LOC111947401 isoform X1 n=2 Tax=Oryzias latipes TaxID=8090 RepID=UPI000CE22E1C|nr:uncharacterized protein LOC111947401 isoform X1 [Oryzias latipes]